MSLPNTSFSLVKLLFCRKKCNNLTNRMRMNRMRKNKYSFLYIFLTAQVTLVFSQRLSTTETWTGKWFPSEPSTRAPPVKTMETSRVPMGEKNASCDDGKTNITMDWDGYFGDFICSSPRTRIIPDKAVDSVIEFENIPKAYMAPHFCMDTEITYDHQLPTFGPHRPLWPVFGEYKFLPKQRWLHTLEHGGIVALYHPCADLREISLLKKLVKSCLRRYVISPSRELSKERPLALLAWGARYTMSVVYPNAVRKFIRERALRGPEKLPDEGQYTMFLKEQSVVVSDFEDSKLCPDDKM